ncbi:MAG TPA: hypothetical protein VMP01_24815 [Pirellulaceae bacterium]|nr:hypothetical protein [Pirellulaceae bacterium]
MNTNSTTTAQQAERLYDQQLRRQLEISHPNAFIAIEPDSGDYFLGRTLSEAVGAARQQHPDRLVHAMRIGHPAAVDF